MFMELLEGLGYWLSETFWEWVKTETLLALGFLGLLAAGILGAVFPSVATTILVIVGLMSLAAVIYYGVYMHEWRDALVPIMAIVIVILIGVKAGTARTVLFSIMALVAVAGAIVMANMAQRDS